MTDYGGNLGATNLPRHPVGCYILGAFDAGDVDPSSIRRRLLAHGIDNWRGGDVARFLGVWRTSQMRAKKVSEMVDA